MQVSVFTAAADRRFLDASHASLRRQTHADWEWVVVTWGNARGWRPAPADPRVQVLEDAAVEGASAAKRIAATRARGEILVALDAGDELEGSCLTRVTDAFEERKDVGFVFSGFSLTGGAGRAREWFEALDPFPHNVVFSRMMPYRLRAYRRSIYSRVGGHDATRAHLCDEDLACRMFEESAFLHLNAPLYIERVPGEDVVAGRSGSLPDSDTSDENTDPQLPDEDREQDVRARHGDGLVPAELRLARLALYESHLQRVALAWARREGFHSLDLGAAHNKPDGYLGVDQFAGPTVDIVADVTRGIDLPDGSVGVIRAVDFLEHVADKIALFNEMYRLLAHGGLLLSLTPSTDGRGAFQDPTHVAYYNQNSFWYFTDPNYSAFVPSIQCKFQVSRVATILPSEWHQQHRISYVNANLVALKDGSRQGGICMW